MNNQRNIYANRVENIQSFNEETLGNTLWYDSSAYRQFENFRNIRKGFYIFISRQTDRNPKIWDCREQTFDKNMIVLVNKIGHVTYFYEDHPEAASNIENRYFTDFRGIQQQT